MVKGSLFNLMERLTQAISARTSRKDEAIYYLLMAVSIKAPFLKVKRTDSVHKAGVRVT
jgi:hypothetical protein